MNKVIGTPAPAGGKSRKAGQRKALGHPCGQGVKAGSRLQSSQLFTGAGPGDKALSLWNGRVTILLPLKTRRNMKK